MCEKNEAIKKSIIHWKNDIIGPLLKGRNIISKSLFSRFDMAIRLYWEDTDTEVPCYSNSCPLCAISADCTDCPYFKKYGDKCCEKGEAWDLFREEPCVERAIEMLEKLEGLLES